MIFSLVISISISSLLYIYLHKKTHISLKYLYIDNIIVILLSTFLSFLCIKILPRNFLFLGYISIIGFVTCTAFCFTMIRFWHTPRRKIKAAANEVVSPADGNVIYINRVEPGIIPVSIKGNTYSKLEELTKTDILDKPCWLIGINMTPFDVHKNCAPIDGQIVLSQYFKGKFLSLKDKRSLVENERNTYVIQNDRKKIGVVQIASKLVKRIDIYVKQGEYVEQGNWLGMIRFGSQVDVILPGDCDIQVVLGQQIYAGTSIIARYLIN